MAGTYPIQRHLIRPVATGDANDILRYPDRPVPEGRRHHITHLSFEDATSTPTEVKVRVVSLEGTFEHLEQVAPQAGRLYFSDHALVISPGEQLEVYFSGATASDVLHAYLQGYFVVVE